MTTRTNRRRNSGFTLMEVTVITVILLLLAATILPNIVSVLNSEQLKADEGTLLRLPAEARNDAVKNQLPVRLRFDGTTVIEEEIEQNGAVDQLKTVALGSSMQVEQVQKNFSTADPSSWNWTAYPDGTSDTGGVQVTVDSEQRSLIIPATGDPTWTTGALPDESQEQWTAGQLLQRS